MTHIPPNNVQHNRTMELSTSQQTLERELQDIQLKKQEFQMLEKRERLVREELQKVNSSSSPIAIATGGRRTQQHRRELSTSPGNGYELFGRDTRQFYPSSAPSGRRIATAATPRSQSNMGVNSSAARPEANMMVCVCCALQSATPVSKSRWPL